MTSRTPPAPSRDTAFPKNARTPHCPPAALRSCPTGGACTSGHSVPGATAFPDFAIASSAFPGAVLDHVPGHAGDALRVRSQAVSVCPSVHDRLPVLCALGLPPQVFHLVAVQTAVHQNVMVDAVGPVLLPSDLCHKQILERGMPRFFRRYATRRRYLATIFAASSSLSGRNSGA